MKVTVRTNEEEDELAKLLSSREDLQCAQRIVNDSDVVPSNNLK